MLSVMYICPQGKRFKYLGIHKKSRQFVWLVCRVYGTGRRASVKDCKVCPLKSNKDTFLSHFSEEQFLLTATVQNIKRMVKLLHRGNKEARKAIQGVANLSNYIIKWLRFIIVLSKTLLFASGRPADNILLLLAYEQV